MASKIDAARSAIERLLRKDPAATMDDCRKAAIKHDPAAKKAAPRSFNARYVLPVKRKFNPPKPKPKPARKARAKTTRAKTRRAKATRAKAPRRAARSRAASNGRLTAMQREAMRALILERDQAVLKTLSGGDARAGYELGAVLDAYIDKLIAASRS